MKDEPWHHQRLKSSSSPTPAAAEHQQQHQQQQHHHHFGRHDHGNRKDGKDGLKIGWNDEERVKRESVKRGKKEEEQRE